MVILSIDPGVERTGYAFFKRKSSSDFSLLCSGLIKTSKRFSQEERFKSIYSELNTLVDTYSPSILVMERLFFTNNQKTAIAVGQSQGVLMLLAAQRRMKVFFLTPTQIKMNVTGSGSSDKQAVQKMLRITLGLTTEVNQDDRADAIACGYAYCCINEALIR